MTSTFLTARWERLVMANYEVAPAFLKSRLPRGTELDLWEGRCYVSLVGFMFLDTRIKGLALPWHRNFEEVNLRFYVRHQTPQGDWKRGVVFISELVPRPAISLVANVVYGEPYRTLPMRHTWEEAPDSLRVAYEWRLRGRWDRFAVIADPAPEPLEEGSEGEFITQHFWGYTRRSDKRTDEYQVEHPPWRLHRVRQHEISVQGDLLYGAPYGGLLKGPPASILLAEGSPIAVRQGRRLP